RAAGETPPALATSTNVCRSSRSIIVPLFATRLRLKRRYHVAGGNDICTLVEAGGLRPVLFRAAQGSRMQKQTTTLAAAGRVLIAVLFLLSGLGKIAAPAMTQGFTASAGLPAPLVGYLIAIIVEVGGGLLLLIGCQTRIVALVLAAFTLAAA